MNSMAKMFIGMHVAMYRISAGRMGGMMMGSNVLLLTTTGRKSGKVHTTPVGCFKRDEGYIIIASNGGADSHPAWYFNLQANPQVTFQVMDKVMTCRAEIIPDEKRAEIWKWVVQTAPQFGKYEKSTTRQIPLILLRP
jgi:deazaflavin-dependent oxidoreductase (nitroreductase family)